MNNLNFISAEIFISLSIMFLLILGVFKKDSSSLIHNLAIGLLLITGILVINRNKHNLKVVRIIKIQFLICIY